MPENDPLTRNAATHLMEAITERVLATCQVLQTLPDEDERRDLLAPMLRRWSHEIHSFEAALERSQETDA